jgi:magnesium transporter
VNPAAQLAAALARDHSEDAARFFERAPAEELAAWLSELPAEHAAKVVACAVPVAAAQALAQMQPTEAAAVIAELEPRIAGALLRRLRAEQKEAVLARLSPRVANAIVVLTRYRADQAASRLDPRAPAVSPETTVEQVLQTVRTAADGALNYVYVVGERQRLCGVVSMRELMLASPSAAVREVMFENPLSVAAEDPLAVMLRHPGWRKAHALPVVDSAGCFLGVIRYSQFRALESELGRSSNAAQGSQAAAALAELFWLGSSAMARLGEAAVFGRLVRDPGERR